MLSRRVLYFAILTGNIESLFNFSPGENHLLPAVGSTESIPMSGIRRAHMEMRICTLSYSGWRPSSGD